MFYRVQIWTSSWPVQPLYTSFIQVVGNQHSSVRLCSIVHKNAIIAEESHKRHNMLFQHLSDVTISGNGTMAEHLQISASSQTNASPNHNSTASKRYPRSYAVLDISLSRPPVNLPTTILPM